MRSTRYQSLVCLQRLHSNIHHSIYKNDLSSILNNMFSSVSLLINAWTNNVMEIHPHETKIASLSVAMLNIPHRYVLWCAGVNRFMDSDAPTISPCSYSLLIICDIWFDHWIPIPWIEINKICNKRDEHAHAEKNWLVVKPPSSLNWHYM